MSSCLVTGGAGFIGSHICEEALRRGWSVRVIDNLSTGKRENLSHLAGPLEFIEADISEPDGVMEAARDVEVIFHLGALVSVPQSCEDPHLSARSNDLGTLNVFEAARVNGARRVIHSSSAAVYGPNTAPPHHEELSPDPVTPYAAHKLLGEHYGRFYAATHGLEAVSLRYFNVYGPRQDPSSPYSGVISIFADRLRSGAPITIFGDGGQTRDFVYVADVVRANFLAAGCDGAVGFSANVATGSAVTVNHLLQTMARTLGVEANPAYGETRTGDIRDSFAAVGKARELLGFKAEVSLEEGLEKLLSEE